MPTIKPVWGYSSNLTNPRVSGAHSRAEVFKKPFSEAVCDETLVNIVLFDHDPRGHRNVSIQGRQRADNRVVALGDGTGTTGEQAKENQ
jgi:hypothetical protein